MIAETEVVPLMLECLPTFRDRWERHIAAWDALPAGSFTDVGQFSHHLVALHDSGDHPALRSGFALVERLLVEGDLQVKDLASIGVLEALQNIGSHRRSGYCIFEAFLGPESSAVWRSLEETWEGRGSLAEVIAAELGVPPPRGHARPWWAFWRPRKPSVPPDAPESIQNPQLRDLVAETQRGPYGRGSGN